MAHADGLTSTIQSLAEDMMAEGGSMCGPVPTSEQAGREQLIALLREGLLPESKVLEFGSGCLRIAYWLVRFLDPVCYHGIEPGPRRRQTRPRTLFSPP